MTALVDNGVPERPTKQYQTENGAVVEAHTVTEDSAGEVRTVDGTRTVKPGDVLLATNRPEVWDVCTESAWNDLGASEVNADAEVTPVRRDDDEEAIPVDEPVEFDPSAHKTTEVRDYLARDDVSEEEKERVRNAEMADLNRASALR